MSRVGLKPVVIPDGVKVSMQDGVITVAGSKGTLCRQCRDIVNIEISDDRITFSRKDNQPFSRSYHGLIRSLVQNMVTGVKDGFTKALTIEGVGYKTQAQGNTVTLNVGYSNPVEYKVPEGCTVKVEGNNKIIIGGFDKQKVGQVAAEIRAIRKPEPYKGKGIRYEGEHVRRKERKSIG